MKPKALRRCDQVAKGIMSLPWQSFSNNTYTGSCFKIWVLRSPTYKFICVLVSVHIWIPSVYGTVLLEHSLVYILFMAASPQCGRELSSWDTTIWNYIKTLWLAKPEILSIWTLTRKVCELKWKFTNLYVFFQCI